MMWAFKTKLKPDRSEKLKFHIILVKYLILELSF